MAVERKKLGELLIEGGLIDQYQLKSALAHQRQWGGRIGANVVKLGFITEQELVAFLSRNFNLPSVELHSVKVPPQVIAAVPKDIAKKYGIIPLQQSPDKKVLTVAMSDPTNLLALDEVTFLVNARVSPVIASDTAIEEAMHHYYDQTARMDFEPGAKLSTEVDFTRIAQPEAKRAVKKDSVSGKIDIKGVEEEHDDVVVAHEDEPMPNFDDLGDSGLDDVLVFTGGSETTISLENRQGPVTPRPAAPAPATAASRTVASASKKEGGAPSTDQLMMALVRLLIDKGLITKEELLSRLK